ncbi:hypothetical protein HUJ05_007353 [Dendroctonus ponderosae]|nr:hypothetical protein HUJ05_007353 [Dendroctonus ponderosae]
MTTSSPQGEEMDEPSENTVHLDFEDENTVPDGAELAPESSEEVAIEPEPKPFSYIEMLDKPRELQEPMDITADYLKVIAQELGLIKLCWPELIDVTFEDRTNFPDSYLKNSRKEKLLLLYAENFRRQFCCKFPNRKPLFLACDNECGLQKMVCTTLRPTILPHAEMYTWSDCSRFLADHIKYEPLDEPLLMVSIVLIGKAAIVVPDCIVKDYQMFE